MRPKPDFLPRMRGATGSVAGRRGLVPKPAATDNNKALFGDGAWRAVSGTGTAATKAEAEAGTDTTKYVAPDALAYALTAKRNALSPSGALAFDGTASTRVYSTLTNQNIGTDAFSLVATFKVPSSAPSADVDVCAISASATTSSNVSSANVVISSAGALLLGVTTTGSVYAYHTLSGFVSAYAGKVVIVVFTRSGTTVALYINGVAQALSAVSSSGGATMGDSVTSTYFLQGFKSSSGVYVGTIYKASLYNLALAQSDVTEIYELGGVVPHRFRFGTQVPLVTEDWSGTNGWTTVSAVISGGVVTFSTEGNLRKGSIITPFRGGTIRYKFDYTTTTPGTLRFHDYSNVATPLALYKDVALSGSGTFDQTYLADSPWSPWGVEFAAMDWSGTMDNLSIYRVGAVVHYDADLDGIGYQLHDQSTNKLHALLTTTGVSWSKAATMGYVRALSDGTTSAQALGGGTILPANCQIIRVRARSISGTPSITLGISSGGSQIVASVALSTTWKDLTIALTGGINTSAASLWMTASAANVVEVQLAYEQLPA